MKMSRYLTMQFTAALLMFAAFYCVLAMLACVFHKKTEREKDGNTVKTETEIRVLKSDRK